MTKAELLKLAVDMRNKQKAYFKTKTRDALIAAKQAEKLFDDATAEKEKEDK